MTLFDVAALLVLVVSALVGLARGVVRELVSLFAFGLAAMAALFLLPITAPLARHMVHPSWAANAVAVAVIFLVAYVALRVMGSTVSAALHRQSTLGAMDRTVGLGFGIVRALVILGVFYLVFSAVPSGFAPRWVSDGRLFPLARASGRALASIAPRGLQTMGGLSHALKNRVSQGVSPDDARNDIIYDDSATSSPPINATPNPYMLRRDAHVRHHRTRPTGRDPVQVE